MDAFELLTAQDKDNIKFYLQRFADYKKVRVGDPAPLNHLLRFWNTNKGTLLKMMGNQLILQRSIEYNKPYEDTCGDIRDAMAYGGKMYTFKNDFRDFSARYAEVHETEDPYLGSKIKKLISVYILADNVYNGDSFRLRTPEGKDIIVQNGCKPSRILAKIAIAFNLEGYEEFRLEHSRILNQKKLTGTMNLSIHPLDFMTMSDNASDWDSCMNWMNRGCYRHGTVEMMNSYYVIVAYFTTGKDMRFFNRTWNDKKWRNLVIVTPEIITTVKGYPYQNVEFETFVLNWVKELAETNLEWQYYSDIISYEGSDYNNELWVEETGITHNFRFDTNLMYNDFGNNNYPYAYVGHAAEEHYNYIEYSGPAECMFCGRELDRCAVDDGDLVDEGALICSDCAHFEKCDSCGEIIDEGDGVYVDDVLLCQSCYENNTVEDGLTGEIHLANNMEYVYLATGPDLNNEVIGDPIQTYNPREIECNSYPEYFKLVGSNLRVGRFNSNSWWSRSEYYVTPDECTEEGLELFCLFQKDRDKIQQYISNFIMNVGEATATA